MNDKWIDDQDSTINKFKKRWRREGYYIGTFLHKHGIPPDNNTVERMNRRFVSIRNDGGGNRTSIGMDYNSILFSVRATCILNGDSFYEFLCNSSGDD